MDKQEQIRSALRKFTAPETATILAIVTSVDEGEKTVVLKDDQTGDKFFDVRLRPVIDGKDFLTIIPKIGTWCLAIRIEDDNEWVVLAVAEAAKYSIKIGETEFKQNASGFEIKKRRRQPKGCSNPYDRS